MKKAPFLLFALLQLVLSFQAFSQSVAPPHIEKVSLYRFEKGVPATAVLMPLDKKDMCEVSIIENGNHIVFTIPGIDKYVSQRGNTRQNISLLVNDIVLPELSSYLLFNDSSTLIFSFELSKTTSENRKLLYRLPGNNEKSAFVGLAFNNNTRLYYEEPLTILFNKHKTGRAWGWVFLAVPLGLLVMILFSKSILKDSIKRLVDSSVNDKKNDTSYSFSKSQFAFWTLIVAISFVYIWWVTNDFGTLNTTALVLLGVSSATIVTSSLIGRSEEDKALENDGKDSGDAKSQSDVDSLAKKRNARINSLIKFRQSENGSKVQSFFLDILSDADGISVHRLQAFAFNLIFGFIFIQQVLTTYSMPEFTETHFILLGLSNGTYAFIKAKENG